MKRKEMGVDSQVVKVFKSLYDNQQAAVRIDKETTEWFRIGKGVRQGCLISPLSFNGYSEKVMRESADILSWIGVTVSGRTINNLRYADDIVLVATSKEALQQLMDRVNETSKKYGLEMNIKKTKVMVVSRNREKIVITCNGGILEQVESFRYLGAIVEESGDGSREIRARLGMARTAMGL
jgi:NADPH:quinone reductase-like Zn-dependent oxidoreductase